MDDQGLAEEIWRAQRTMEEELPAVSESKSVEPLTYAKFLECLDKRRHDNYKRLEYASVNKWTFLFLVGNIGYRDLTSGTGDCTIHGVDMYIDEHLPDHAIKMDGVIYNAPKESSEDPRDTQFAGFAKLVVAQLLEIRDTFIDTTNDHWREEWELAIAQCAYDLAYHVASETIGTAWATDTSMRGIPDMTEWPEEIKK